MRYRPSTAVADASTAVAGATTARADWGTSNWSARELAEANLIAQRLDMVGPVSGAMRWVDKHDAA